MATTAAAMRPATAPVKAGTGSATETAAAETAARYGTASDSTAREPATCHGATSESTAREPASNRTTSNEAGATREVLAREAAAAVDARSASKAGAGEPASPKARPAKPRPKAKAAEPRAGSDEDASSKPVRAVVAVGRASIRVIAIVAVRAAWRATYVPIPWPNSNTDNHSLCIRIRRTKHANTQQTKNSEISHLGPPSEIHHFLLPVHLRTKASGTSISPEALNRLNPKTAGKLSRCSKVSAALIFAR